LPPRRSYAYVGFDVIATSAEETKDPNRTIPLAIILSLVLCACAYVAVSAVVVGMVPYTLIDTSSPLASAFALHGVNWAKYIISIGAVSGLSTSLMTCIFPMPRIVYAIAQDGLLPPWMARVSPRFNTPVLATMLCGTFAATMALIFDIEALADMMSIGTLMSYTLVATSILVLRYRDTDVADAAAADAAADAAAAGDTSHGHAAYDSKAASSQRGRGGSIEAPLVTAAGVAAVAASASVRPRFSPFGNLFRVMSDGSVRVQGVPVAKGRAIVLALMWFVGGMSLAVVCAAVIAFTSLSGGPMYGVIGVATFGLLIAVTAGAAVGMLPWTRPTNVSFLTPLFPWVPLASIAINLYLLANLSYLTWVRFAVWCVIGAAIYGGYGIRHSKAEVDTSVFGEDRHKRHVSDDEDAAHAHGGGSKGYAGVSTIEH
jgi:hypothetical protein